MNKLATRWRLINAPWEIRGKTGIYQLYEVVGTRPHSG